MVIELVDAMRRSEGVPVSWKMGWRWNGVGAGGGGAGGGGEVTVGSWARGGGKWWSRVGEETFGSGLKDVWG